MSLEKIEKVRVCLREKEINLQGEMGKEDKKILAQLRIIIEETIAKIDFLFNLLAEKQEDEKQESLSDFFDQIYRSLVKAFLRYRRKFDESYSLTEESLEFFWQEIQEVIELFNRHGLKVDSSLLNEVLLYGGFDYWNEFFEKEFYFFQHHSSLVRKAIFSLKTDPRTFLLIAKENIEAMLKEEEFVALGKKPSIFYHAAIYSHEDPRGFLRKAIRNAKVILREEEFSGFALSTVLDMAVKHLNDPRKFLRAYGRKHPRRMKSYIEV